MKRTIFICLICLTSACLWAQKKDDTLKFFEGIGTSMGKSDTIKMRMEDQLEYIHSQLEGQENLKIVGQSQGGLRAIAYAGYLNRLGRASNLNTVISIGGPVNGFSPLIQGSAVFRQKVDSAANTLRNGWAAVENFSDKPKEASTILENGGIEGLIEGLGVGDDFLLGDILKNMDTNSSIPDMKPYSAFMADYLNTTRCTIEWRQIKILGITIPFFPVVNELREWKLPKNVAYGFIVGTDSNIYNLAKDFIGGGVKIGDFPFSTISVEGLAVFYGVMVELVRAGWQAVAASYNLRALVASITRDREEYEKVTRYAAEARKWSDYAEAAREWITNAESRYAEILGTEPGGNDGFIPVRDQYIDVAQFGGQYVEEWSKGKYTGDSTGFNHANELNHPLIWGKGGSMTTRTIGRDGRLARWLYETNVSWNTIEGKTVK